VPDEPVYRDDEQCRYIVKSLIAQAEPQRGTSRINKLLAETRQVEEEALVPSDPKNAAMYYALLGVPTAHIGAVDLYCVDVRHCRKRDLAAHHWHQVATRLESECQVFQHAMRSHFEHVRELEQQIAGYKKEARWPLLAVGFVMGFVLAVVMVIIKLLVNQ
jgi:hypothetical protein